MSFNFIAWVLGWSLGKFGDSIVSALTPSELNSRLSATIMSWANDLPAECQLEPSAIFVRDELQPGPARRLLFQRLTDSQPPSEGEWHSALVERWQAIQDQDGGLQSFFMLQEADASTHLRALAGRLAAVCRADERMFRNATLGLGQRVHGWLQEMPTMWVNEIVEPKEWNLSYDLGVHIHNSTGAGLLLTNLRTTVSELSRIERSVPKTPGSPIEEHPFEVVLNPEPGSVNWSAVGPRRFTLKTGETEFFRLKVSAEPGWDYLIQLSGDAIGLHDGKKFEAQTPSFWLGFERVG